MVDAGWYLPAEDQRLERKANVRQDTGLYFILSQAFVSVFGLVQKSYLEFCFATVVKYDVLG